MLFLLLLTLVCRGGRDRRCCWAEAGRGEDWEGVGEWCGYWLLGGGGEGERVEGLWGREERCQSSLGGGVGGGGDSERAGPWNDHRPVVGPLDGGAGA